MWPVTQFVKRAGKLCSVLTTACALATVRITLMRCSSRQLVCALCRYLTPAGALWRFLTFRGRKNRFLLQRTKGA